MPRKSPPTDKVTKTERLLNLVSYLLKESRSPVAWHNIKEHVVGYDDDASESALERRFERDKDELRHIGVPVEYIHSDEHGEEGYVIPADEYFLPRMELTAEESLLLRLVGEIALQEVPGPIAENVRSAVQKIQFYSPLADGPDSSLERTHVFQPQISPLPTREEKDSLRILSQATLESKTVRFSYYTIGRDDVGLRRIDPYGLGYSDGVWYLVGYSHLRESIRVFNVNRIRGQIELVHPRRSGPEFSVPSDFRIKDYVGRAPWEMAHAEPQQVRVRFHPDIAWMVREKAGEETTFEWESDGWGTLTLQVTDMDAILRWVLEYVGKAEIISPPQLRDKLVETIVLLRSRYED